jgi:cyclopropane fatty-acyl-phospholipid synthase-like methyltransferase
MNQTWDERYKKEGFYYGKEPNDFLRQNSELFKKGMKVLCLAEGEGRNSVYLATLGCDVTALDFSSVALNKLKSLAQEKSVSVQTVCSDLADYKIGEDQWDAIISIWCHVPSAFRQTLHKSVSNGLKKGGFVKLEAYTPKQIPKETGGPKDPDMLPTAKLLHQEFSGLDIQINKELDRDIQEGKAYQGLSSVVQLLAYRE